jgi:hypothetical protein
VVGSVYVWGTEWCSSILFFSPKGKGNKMAASNVQHRKDPLTVSQIANF